MRYFTSDLHGEYELFCRLLDKIKFAANDEMIICGDIIDKGAEPIKLAKLIFSMPNVRCIMGNHEYEFLKFYWSLMKESPEDFDEVLDKLRAYHRNDGHLLDWDTVDVIENLPFYIEEEEFLCVHAGIPLNAEKKFVPLNSVSREQFVYDRIFKEPSVLPRENKCVLFGHTPAHYVSNRSEIITYPRIDKPQSIKDYYKVHLDTGTYLVGVMGCFCMETLECVYVSK